MLLAGANERVDGKLERAGTKALLGEGNYHLQLSAALAASSKPPRSANAASAADRAAGDAP